MHCEVAWILVISEGTSIMVLKLTRVNHEFTVGFRPLVWVLVNDLFVVWLDLSESSLTMASFIVMC